MPMEPSPYERFRREDLILRDELAIDRTILANERTVLAYSRTALTLLIVGVTFLHFPDRPWLASLGLLFVPAGLAVGLFGSLRYLRMRRTIAAVRADLADHDQSPTAPPPGGPGAQAP